MFQKIIVTGAAGFIGSQLLKRLKDKQIDCIGIDNFNNHLYDPELKVARVKEFGLDVKVEDIRNYDGMVKILNEFRPDLIVHLAAHAGVRDSFGKEANYHSNNIDGTQSLIDACKTLDNPPRVIYASTSSVYGGTKVLPWVEEQVDGHQLNAYAYTKYANECQFKVSELNNTGLRFFTVYGPWGRPDMALFQFTKNIIDGKEIQVYNYGDMKRDFTYVEDILDGIEIIINANILSGEIFNIGRGRQVPLLDFVNEIEKNCGKEGKIKFVERHPADTLETWSDVTKLQELGYQPKVDVEQGIEEFYKWYKWYYGVN
jgi:UDP-glucuronate 4-epimerase